MISPLFDLARNLAIEWGPKNIRVNAVSPGVITTDCAVSLTEVPDMVAPRSAIGFHQSGRKCRPCGMRFIWPALQEKSPAA